jgi:hypothetical protein
MPLEQYSEFCLSGLRGPRLQLKLAFFRGKLTLSLARRSRRSWRVTSIGGQSRAGACKYVIHDRSLH